MCDATSQSLFLRVTVFALHLLRYLEAVLFPRHSSLNWNDMKITQVTALQVTTFFIRIILRQIVNPIDLTCIQDVPVTN